MAKKMLSPREICKGVFPGWLIKDMFRKRKHTKRDKELAKLFAKRINETNDEEGETKMKILKKGKIIHTNAYYKDTCGYCGCVFEFTHADIEEQEKKLDGKATYRCPYCSRKIEKRLSELESREVKEEYIPEDFRDDEIKED